MISNGPFQEVANEERDSGILWTCHQEAAGLLLLTEERYVS